jgi:hypothetical protein
MSVTPALNGSLQFTFTDTQMTTDTVTLQISATEGGHTYTDTMTFVKCREGIDSLNGFLTNENLTMPADYLGNIPDVRVWGNGADFDNPILAVAYRRTIFSGQPWKPYNGRCYRTVKNQFQDVKLVRTGTHHNALDDARSQATHLVEICRTRGWRLA